MREKREFLKGRFEEIMRSSEFRQLEELYNVPLHMLDWPCGEDELRFWMEDKLAEAEIDSQELAEVFYEYTLDALEIAVYEWERENKLL